MYACTHCGHRFQRARRTRTHFITQLWTDYVFHKQTVPELAIYYDHDPRTIRGLLDLYVHPHKVHHPRPIHVIVDTTYFGERKEGSSWCVMVARDATTHEDLVWVFADSETTSGYRTVRDVLEHHGYTILSVTGDGFGGIPTGCSGIPYQMCHVHMERIVIRGTTRNPKTEAGCVLLALVRSLHTTNSHLFHVRLTAYIERYHDVLNEKTFTPASGEWDWTHRPLRQAVLSLERLRPFLFTFEHDTAIPKTTNALEGHFAHMKLYLGVHRGVNRSQAERILHSLLLASSVSPSHTILNEIC